MITDRPVGHWDLRLRCSGEYLTSGIGGRIGFIDRVPWTEHSSVTHTSAVQDFYLYLFLYHLVILHLHLCTSACWKIVAESKPCLCCRVKINLPLVSWIYSTLQRGYVLKSNRKVLLVFYFLTIGFLFNISLEKIFYCENNHSVQQSPQGHGGIPTSGDFQDATRKGVG